MKYILATIFLKNKPIDTIDTIALLILYKSVTVQWKIKMNYYGK